MEIKINKEIKEYNETVFFGLSVRQFVFSILACGAAVAIYFGGRSFWIPKRCHGSVCSVPPPLPPWALSATTECMPSRS